MNASWVIFACAQLAALVFVWRWHLANQSRLRAAMQEQWDRERSLLETRLQETQQARAEEVDRTNQARQTLQDALKEKEAALQDVATLTERASRLARLEDEHLRTEKELGALRDQLDEQRSRVRELETILAKEREATQEKLALLAEAKGELADAFKSLAAEILDDKSQKFSEQSKKDMDQLLGPVKGRLEDFQKLVREFYEQEGKDRTALLTQVQELTKLNNSLSAETQNLTLALKGDNKAQGNFGEILLDDVLQRAGLLEGQHYTRQGGVRAADGRQVVIPDVVLNLPGGRHLVIDSKFTLPDYRAFMEGSDEIGRNEALARHIKSIRSHIKGLSEKNYQSDYGLTSLDFVVMFVPLEPAFMLAVTHDQELFTFGWEKNVLLVSPSTLLFVVRTVAHLWRQEALAKNARDISARGAELYARLVGFVEELQRVGDRLDDAQKAFGEAKRKLSQNQGNVIRQAEMLRDLGVKPKKALPAKWVEEATESLDEPHDEEETSDA